MIRIVHDVPFEHEAVESLSMHLNKQLSSVTVTQSLPDSICVDNDKHVTKTVCSTHKNERQDTEYKLEKVMLKLNEKNDYTIVCDQGVCVTVRV